jgi:hypothetical protein
MLLVPCDIADGGLRHDGRVSCSLCSGMLFMSSEKVGYWIMHISVGDVQVHWTVLFF